MEGNTQGNRTRSVRFFYKRQCERTRDDVKRFYASHLGCTQKECARALGISPVTVCKYISEIKSEWQLNKEGDDACNSSR